MFDFIKLPGVAEKSLVEIVQKYPPRGWNFHNFINEIKHCESRIAADVGNYTPEPNEVFNAFYYTPFDKVRVVMIGSAPTDNSKGLAFSLKPGSPLTFESQYICSQVGEVGKSGPDFDGDLSRWALEEGVLLLNLSLTTKKGCVNSHKNVWLPLVGLLLKQIAQQQPKTVFILWGKEAQSIKRWIGSCKTFEGNYPNLYGTQNDTNHFDEVNDWFMSRGEPPINWRLD